MFLLMIRKTETVLNNCSCSLVYEPLCNNHFTIFYFGMLRSCLLTIPVQTITIPWQTGMFYHNHCIAFWSGLHLSTLKSLLKYYMQVWQCRRNVHLTVKLIRNPTKLWNGRTMNRSLHQLFDCCWNNKVGHSECSFIQQTTDGMLESLC